MKKSFLILTIGVASSQVVTAQLIVEDVAAVGTLQALLWDQREEKYVRDLQHKQMLGTQRFQHAETLKRWASHFRELKKNWEILNQTRQLISRQLDFIKQIQNATGDPKKFADLSFKKIDREIFSRNGIMDHLSDWLKRSKSLGDWGTLLESLFEPLDSSNLDSKTLRNRIRSLEYKLYRLRRREAIERAYKEAEALQAQTRTLREKLTQFLENLRVEVRSSGTISEMQKLGLHVSVTEKGMRSAIGIGEDLAKRLMELKTLADNRDAIEEELKKHVRNLDHNEASAAASKNAREMYRDSRLMGARLTGSVSMGRDGRIRNRTSIGMKLKSTNSLILP